MFVRFMGFVNMSVVSTNGPVYPLVTEREVCEHRGLSYVETASVPRQQPVQKPVIHQEVSIVSLNRKYENFKYKSINLDTDVAGICCGSHFKG